MNQAIIENLIAMLTSLRIADIDNNDEAVAKLEILRLNAVQYHLGLLAEETDENIMDLKLARQLNWEWFKLATEKMPLRLMLT